MPSKESMIIYQAVLKTFLIEINEYLLNLY